MERKLNTPRWMIGALFAALGLFSVLPERSALAFDVEGLASGLDPIVAQFGVEPASPGPGGIPSLSPGAESCAPSSPSEDTVGVAPDALAQIEGAGSVAELIEWTRVNQALFLNAAGDSADDKAARHRIRLLLSKRLNALYLAEHPGQGNQTEQIDQQDLWRVSRAIQRKGRGVTAGNFRDRILNTLRVIHFRESSSDIIAKLDAYTQELIEEGVRYRYGAESGAWRDCSGFIQDAAGEIGLSLPRTSGAMRAYMRRLRDEDGRKIAISDPRKIEVGTPYILAYGHGKGSAHVVAILKYPDGTAKVWESSTRHRARSGPRFMNYRSVTAFLTSRGLISRRGTVRKDPAAAPIEGILDATSRRT